jgi:two-component system, cell cycle sensor histidine kinase and response regulator CckA
VIAGFEGSGMMTDQRMAAGSAETGASLRRVMDASPVGIIVFDHDVRIIHANCLAERFFDKSVTTSRGLRCGDFIDCFYRHSEPRGCGHTAHCPTCPLFIGIQAALEGRQDASLTEGEVLLERESGKSAMWVKFKINRLEIGGHGSAVMAIDDITAQKQAALSLSESENLLNSIFRAAPTGIGVTRNRTLTMVNDRICEMVGRDRGELIGESTRILYASEAEYEYVGTEKYRQIAQHGTGSVEAVWVCKNGRKIDVLLSSTLNNPGDPFGLVTFTALDITERKQAEQALIEREQYLRTILHTTVDGFWVVDRHGRIVDVNEAYCRMSGYSTDELLQMRVGDIDAIETPAEIKAHVERVRAKGSEIFETRHRRKDGSLFDVEMSVTYLDSNDGRLICFCRDISERKLSDRALKDSEEKYRRIAENSTDVVWTMDLNLRMTYVSPSVERLLGETVEAHLIKPVEKKLTKDSLKSVFEILKAELERENIPGIDKGRTRVVEVEFYKADGTTVWTSLNAGFIRDASGNVVGIQGVTRDITERRRSEAELQESEKRLREAQEIARLARWELDIGTGRLMWSDGIYDLFEVSREIFASSYDAFLSFIHPDDIDLVNQAYREAVTAKKPYEIEHRLLMKDGRVKWVSEIGRTEYDDLGIPVRSIGTVQEITERKQAEENLRKQNQFIETILNNLPIGLAVHSIESQEVTYMNKNFEKIYGWPMAEISDVNDFFEKVYPDPEYRNALRPRFLQDIESGDPRRMHWENLEVTGQDGSKRIVSAVNIPLVGQNVMVSTVQDVTERIRNEKEHQRLQEQLTQAQKMESVGRLAGGVAHDYNNMLSVIIGYTELAMDKVRKDDPLHSDLAEILKAARRSTEITRQLLAFARKQTIAPKVVDLNAIVESMLRMLGRLIGEDIDLVWRPGKQLWSIKIDPAQVDQVLANLCVNARDAIAGIGKVTIETHNFTCDKAYCAIHAGFLPGDFVSLTVSDDGCGMDKETLNSIFEPFFTTKGVDEGTGLGLATVYGIVKQNNGFINVYSEPGKGTAFKVCLPRFAGDKPRSVIQKTVNTPASHGETLLLVEDEPAIMKMAQMMLKRLGYRAMVAGSPSQAMEMAKDHPGAIDLLITDVVMPEMNGRKLSEQMSSLYPGLKTLFMSGYTANVIAHRGVLEEGMNFIQKPFSLHDLGVKVRAVLDG